MDDEVDVDIEGDEFQSTVSEIDEGCLAQEQFIQSAWKSSAGILPWELDSSISPENRQVIEKMLLEEQYYLTGEKVHNHIWDSNSSSKSKAKKPPVKTSASASSASSRWSKQEKELFENGLAQFGRRWTKIAKLVGSRSVLQVKSYARQYFKHKAKSEPRAAASSAGLLKLQHAQPASSTLANTVRIEKLSDEEDEEVDITDDLCNDGDSDHKPPVDNSSESEGLEGIPTQTENPKEEQDNGLVYELGSS
ncbi:hypothetical protein fugu_005702 [Takifugu bimaculatus]|uniref:Uncharacterized protein n=1 Tax=Takifugu bimaculatus TaxID=433685 RepID=A0A4Z2B545_9TELE|nr:hypothetical protein fugu_005702 [Takifugu bimaculatus]